MRLQVSWNGSRGGTPTSTSTDQLDLPTYPVGGSFTAGFNSKDTHTHHNSSGSILDSTSSLPELHSKGSGSSPTRGQVGSGSASPPNRPLGGNRAGSVSGAAAAEASGAAAVSQHDLAASAAAVLQSRERDLTRKVP